MSYDECPYMTTQKLKYDLEKPTDEKLEEMFSHLDPVFNNDTKRRD